MNYGKLFITTLPLYFAANVFAVSQQCDTLQQQQFCVETMNTSLSCEHDKQSGFVEFCYADVVYKTSTDYQGNGHFRGYVACEVEVAFTNIRSDLVETTAELEEESVTQHANKINTGRSTLFYYFTKSDQINGVSILNSQCQFTDAELW